MSKNRIEELLKEVDKIFDESNKLDTEAEKHLLNGNELEWEEAKIKSVEREAYAKGIKYTLKKLNLI